MPESRPLEESKHFRTADKIQTYTTMRPRHLAYSRDSINKTEVVGLVSVPDRKVVSKVVQSGRSGARLPLVEF